MKIYEGNSKAWNFLTIRLTYIPFGLARKCNENSHEACKALVEKYDVSDDKQESLNEVTNRWNNYSIKDTSQDPDIWLNEQFNSDLKFNKIKAKYEKYGYYMKAHVFISQPKSKNLRESLVML